MNNNIADILFHPIGIIYSPYIVREGMPIQASRSHTKEYVEVYREFAEGLQDLEGFSHIFLLYVFHESLGYSLLARPFLDDQVRGLFATRYPFRPNPIGISVVRLLTINNNILEIEGVDMLNGTPLLDIKPYVPEFDIRTDTHSGWYESI